MNKSYYVEVPSLRAFQAPLYRAMDLPGMLLNGAGLVYLPNKGAKVAIRKPVHSYLKVTSQILAPYPDIYLVLAEVPPEAPPTQSEQIRTELYGLGLAVCAIVLGGTAVATSPVWAAIGVAAIAAGAAQGINAVFRTCNAVFCPDSNELVDSSALYKSLMFVLDAVSAASGGAMAAKFVRGAGALKGFTHTTKISFQEMDEVLSKVTREDVKKLSEHYRQLHKAGKIQFHGNDELEIDQALRTLEDFGFANMYLLRNMPAQILRQAAKQQLSQAFSVGSALTILSSALSVDYHNIGRNDNGLIGRAIVPPDAQAEVSWDDAQNTVTIRSRKYNQEATFYWTVWQQGPSANRATHNRSALGPH